MLDAILGSCPSSIRRATKTRNGLIPGTAAEYSKGTLVQFFTTEAGMFPLWLPVLYHNAEVVTKLGAIIAICIKQMATQK